MVIYHTLADGIGDFGSETTFFLVLLLFCIRGKPELKLYYNNQLPISVHNQASMLVNHSAGIQRVF